MKINKGFIYLSSPLDNFKFNYRRGKGHLLAYIIDRIRWHVYPRIHRVSTFPTHVDVELSSACNLNCSMCYTTTDAFKKNVERSNMTFDLFKKIVDECAQYKSHYSIRLSWRGEPFLNPHIIDMVKYAKSKGIKEIATLSHGGFLDPEKFEELMDAGLDWLTLSTDGVGEEYEKIREPLNFKEHVEKIKKYNEIKKKRGSVKPVIKIQGVWPAVEKGADEYFKIFSPIADQVTTSALLDFLRKDTEQQYIENFTCPVLFQRLTIGSNGKAYQCYNDELGTVEVGDTNKETLHEIWHGKKFQRSREMQLKHLGVKELPPCKYCQYPRKTQKEKAIVGEKTKTIQNVTNRPQVVGK